MHTHTGTPPSVAPHARHHHQLHCRNPRLAPRHLPSSPHQHSGVITLSSRSQARTIAANQPRSWSETAGRGSSMSDHRRNSLGRRLSRRLSSWRGDGKVEGKVDDDVENAVGNAEEGVGASSQVTVGAPKPEHLVILVNGIWGSVRNWIFAANELKQKLGDKGVIHCSASNGGLKTHAGVDVMGKRLAEEVKRVVDETPGLTKISFVGHSLGGLIARYAIGKLYAPSGGEAPTSETKAGGSGRDHVGGTIAGLEPVNFITLATPHLGCRGNYHLPFLFGRTSLEWAAPFVSPLIIGPTGRHLFLADGDKDRQPLLERIVTNCDDGQFLSALACFKRRVAYANVRHDRMVGWRTASIRKASEMPEPLEEPEEERLKDYKYIVREEEVPLANKNSSGEGGSEPKDAPALDDFEEVMVAGLQQVPWHRVDVNFSKDDPFYEAHNLIQVKNAAWHIQGQYVIRHIIDNYF